MRSLLVFIVLMSSVFNFSISQGFVHVDKSLNKFYNTNNNSTLQKPFEVLHYDIYANLEMVNSSFHGIMTIKVLITEDSPTAIWFHSLGLVYLSVQVNDSIVPYVLDEQNELCTINLLRTYTVGETLRVRMDYYRDPN